MNYGILTLTARLARTALRTGEMVVALLFLCGAARSIQAADLTVSMMPSYGQNGSQGNAALNENIQIWGRVYGGSKPYATYTIDFGDGSAVATGMIDNAGVLPKTVAQTGQLAIPAYIGAGHAYATAGSKTVTLTVTDSVGASASQTATIRVRLAPTHVDRINIAVENGLRYLYLAQKPNGPIKSFWTENTSQYGWASTSLALMALEENGHLAGNDYALDVYAETVQKGINNLVAAGHAQDIAMQNGQVTDTNGNGKGIYVGSTHVYDHCLAALAIIGAYPSKAAAQAAAIPYNSLGESGSNFPSFPGVASFYDFTVDLMDTLLWCQSDTGLLGWHYRVDIADNSDSRGNGGADGSTHQWPNMVFVAAKDRWGLVPPAWAVTNSMNAYVALQDHTHDPVSNIGYGGCGYDAANSWRNNGKTGGMLACFPLGGKFVGPDFDANIAYDFIGRTWITPPSDGTLVDINSGWPGNWYYMYGIKKGLQLQNVATVNAQYDDVNGGPRDWYADLSAWLVGNAALLDAPTINNPNNIRISPDLRTPASMFGQFTDGHWEGHAWPSHNGYPAIQTAGAILTLSESITVAVPVAVIAPVPDQSARRPAPFQLDGSASYDLDPSNSIVEWLWKFDAGANPDWSNPDAVGQRPTVNPGWNTESTHTVSLRVRDNQNPVQYGTVTAKIKVTINDHPPVAVPLPPTQVPQVYAGKIGATIQLDGTASYDVDGDPIVSYAWDLNGDGKYGDATDAALDTSGLGAHGSTASMVFGTPQTGVVGLQVGSQAPRAGILYSVNQAAIDIYTSASDLSVQSLSVTNVQAGNAADVRTVLKNDPASPSGLNGVMVRFYDGDPYNAGAQIGTNYMVNLPVGGTTNLDVHLPLTGGQQFIYVKVDANDSIPEWNEQNNVAGISIFPGANQPPVARAKNVIVVAEASGTANASIDNGSYDPDGDTITLRQNPTGPYPVGVTKVTLVVTDSHGAASQAKATVTVLDKTLPQLVLPADIVVNTDPGQSTAIVTYSVSGRDGTAAAKVTTDIPSGTAFPIGATVVTATVRDAFGNAISGSFTVTVMDAEPPVVRAYDLTVAATGDAGVAVNYPPATVIDNVGVASVTYSQARGTVFPLGVTPVTITAKDAAGNVGTGQFSVRVVLRSEPRAVQPTVPRLVRLPLAQAQASVANAKLWVGTITTATSTTVPAGSVISQVPLADTSVPPDSIVSLVLSLGAPVKVPKLVGLSEPRAQAVLAAARLRAGSVAKVNSTTVPVGNVVTQFPAAGASVLPGSAVDLTESFGPAATSMPNVVGLAQSVAEKSITGAGLIVGLVTTTTSATVPPGVVISETPVAGSVVAAGSAVQITVSLGAAVTVPNVVGYPQAQALTALLESDLTVGTITKANSEAVAAGSVIKQAPMAGSTVTQGTPVSLVISLGATAARVPNVVEFTEARAQTSILTARLTVGAENLVSSATVAAGKVISQSPAAGATLPQGSAITLTISSGPTQTGVPSVVGLTQSRAEAALTAAKLTVGAISTANSLTVTAGNVISQNPLAGTFAAPGSAVALTISLGPPPVAVPNVVGKTQVQAQSTLVAARLTYGSITTASSPTVAAGTVLSQTPQAGTMLPQGSAVALTVSVGPPIAVPNVVGLPQSQASLIIAGAKLAVGGATSAPSLTVPVGSVISQTPAADTMVAQNSAVNLVISLGPPLANVPNVVGLPQAQAQADLVSANLSIGPLTSATSANVPLGNVISQSPSAGTSVAQKSPVNLTISLGPPVKVPNVVGLVQAQAQTNITAANLGVGSVTTAYSTTVAAGKVISQTPSAGSIAAKGSSVNLIVSSGATLATVPNVVGLAQADASIAIVAAGFTVGTVTPGISATIPAGQIFGQSPTPGSVVAAPSPVNITVSAGPGNTIVPNLAGLTQPQARATLFLAQLLLGTVTLNPSTTVPAGQISAQSPAAGSAATVGGTVNVTISVGPFVANDTVTPVVTIQSPAVNSTVTSLTDVVATVTDANLAFYQVDVARADKVDLSDIAADNSAFTVIGQGSANVNNAKVATFDPTNLANDTYVIRVRATDRGGHIYAIYTIVNVSGNAKLGRFALDFTDLSVPLVGIPIQIVRHYDSFNAGTNGDFGYGWSLGLRDAEIRALLRPSFAGPTLAPDSRLYLTTPDGRRVGFTAKFDVLSQFIGTIVRVSFTPDPGVYEKVEILDGDQTYLSSGVFLGGLLGSEVYVPQKYRLTLKDGTKYDYDTIAGLQKITDLSGNTVTLTANAISHSSGQSITLTRDPQNRITSITDPAGKAVTYGYSAQGDLISFTDRTGLVTKFTYRVVPSHYLDSVIDPLGHMAVRTEYDENGRVVATIDALGNRQAQSFDPAAFTGTYTDGLGKISIVKYDARGNLTEITDPLGAKSTFVYDAANNVLQATVPCPCGAGTSTTTRTYDAAGNILSVTDGLGQTRTFVYNALNKVTDVTDQLGHKTHYNFNAKGNITSIVNAAGVTSSITYDASGRPSSFVDNNGNTTQLAYGTGALPSQITFADNSSRQLAYNGQGQVTKVTDELDHATTLEYDATGRLTKLTDAQGNPTLFQYQGSQLAQLTDALGRVTKYTYDDAGRRISETNALGYTVRSTYDANNQLLSTQDARGSVTSYEYREDGKVEGIVDALGNVTTNTYDANGNKIATTDPLGRATHYDYDKLGRVIAITNSLGGILHFTFDAAGNRLSQTDENGNTTAYAYDALNRLITETDATGAVTTRVYDNASNLVRLIDALDRSTSNTYDNRNRLIRRIDPQGGIETFSYDVASRRTSSTDQLGKVTSFEYDNLGRVLKTIDALNGTLVNAYDAVGNLISVADQNSKVTKFAYDALNRKITTTDANGGVSRSQYDEANNQVSFTDPVNNTTQFAYDAMNRLVDQTDPVGHHSTFKYDTAGNRIEAVDRNLRKRVFAYDPLNRITSETWLDGATEVRKMTFGYDAVGNLLSATDPDSTVTQTFDRVNRPLSVDNLGTPGAPRLSLQYGRDAIGNATSVSDNGGFSVQSIYDANNQLSQRTWQGGNVAVARMDFVHDATGRRTMQEYFRDLAGTQSGGSSLYVRDALGRVTTLTHQNPTGAALAAYTNQYYATGLLKSEVYNGVTSQYTYDPTGQLTAAAHSPGTTENFQYDKNGNRTGAGFATASGNQLQSDGKFTYTYDNEGNLVSRTAASGNRTEFTYDHRNRLTRVQNKSDSGALLQTIAFTFDTQDRRIRKNVDGVATDFGYNGLNAWADSVAGTVTHRYLFGDQTDEVLARHSAGTAVSRYLTDKLGSIRDAASSSGALAGNTIYQAFGNVVSRSGTLAGDRFSFTGREFDPECGTYHYRARAYLPTSGRFLSQDPLGLESDRNPYRYVGNSPLNFTDPSGLEATLGYIIPPARTSLPLAVSAAGEEAFAARLVGSAIVESGVSIAARVGPGVLRVTGGIGRTLTGIAALFAAIAIEHELPSKEIVVATVVAGIFEATATLRQEDKPCPDRRQIGPSGTAPGSPFPAGSRDPYKYDPVNPGKDPNGCCNACPPNSPAWEVLEPGHGGAQTHWHWIEYNQIPGSCECKPVRRDAGSKPPGA